MLGSVRYLCDPRHIVEKLVLRVGAEIGGGNFLLGRSGTSFLMSSTPL